MIDARPLDGLQTALVFGPALLGYLGLSLVAAAAVHPASAERPWHRVGLVTLALITVHVALLWWLRYGFDPALATRNGFGGFLTFHAALVTVWLTLPFRWLRSRWRRVALVLAWGLVTSGAVGAPFRYDVVADLAVPVIAIAALGALGLAVATRARAIQRARSRRILPAAPPRREDTWPS